jgi:hypothetical protein
MGFGRYFLSQFHFFYFFLNVFLMFYFSQTSVYCGTEEAPPPPPEKPNKIKKFFKKYFMQVKFFYIFITNLGIVLNQLSKIEHFCDYLRCYVRSTIFGHVWLTYVDLIMLPLDFV